MAIQELDALPVQRFTKDILREGQFLPDENGKPRLTVTGEYLDKLIQQFERMRTDGHRIAVTNRHTDDPEATRGFIHRLWRDGRTLKAEVELRGADAISLARRNPMVSVAVAGSWKDGEGRIYAPALRHLAFVQSPAVSGLDEFREIAASADGGGPLFVLHHTSETTEEIEPMATTALTLEQLRAEQATVTMLEMAADGRPDVLTVEERKRLIQFYHNAALSPYRDKLGITSYAVTCAIAVFGKGIELDLPELPDKTVSLKVQNAMVNTL